jgi:hypothetical protein
MVHPPSPVPEGTYLHTHRSRATGAVPRDERNPSQLKAWCGRDRRHRPFGKIDLSERAEVTLSTNPGEADGDVVFAASPGLPGAAVSL